MTSTLPAPADGEPYARNLLFADATREVLAMRWRAGATCAPHDHGQAGGVVHLVVGKVVERRYVFDGRALRPVAEHGYEAPAVLAVEPGVIHDIQAIGGASQVLTIHHYEPRIAQMRVYDVAGRRTLVVADDCGAWVPRDASLIVHEEAWSDAGLPHPPLPHPPLPPSRRA